MQASDVRRAVAEATSTASDLGLTADEAIVLHNSNRLAVRLLPSDVLVRVARKEHQAEFEVELAERLAATKSPIASLDPRVEPGVYERDGFDITFWTYYEPVSGEVPPAEYAQALECLHAGMRQVDVIAPHFSDRVAEAQQIVGDVSQSPDLLDADRELLSKTLDEMPRATSQRLPVEQLLHGEPHPGNLLCTKYGLRFIDLETCCRGPVEFDLAHVPWDVSDLYPDVDEELLQDCRVLVLAMVAAWRWDAADLFPHGQRAGNDLLSAIREGPPWPTLDEVTGRDVER